MTVRRDQLRYFTVVSGVLFLVLAINIAAAFVGRIVSQRMEIARSHEPPPEGMVYVPAGTFIMGSDASYAEVGEYPARNVFVKAFYIDRYEVTNEDFRRVFPDHGFPPEKALHPVTNVTKEMAEEYCRAVGKRLPTSAEWEKAARGTDGRIYPWGNLFDPNAANLDDLCGGMLPVGSFPAGVSLYGVHDMAGNAWEWVSDVHVDRVPFGDSGPTRGILRGGAHGYGKLQARSSYVGFEGLANTCHDTGFRCAQDAAPSRKN